MPTYDYLCKKCGHEFEVVHSISAPALTVCPKDLCLRKKWGRGAVTKKVGAGAGLLFKGSGFYITDYRSEGYKSAAKKETGGETKAPAKTEPSAGTKPAAKAAPEKTARQK